EGRGLAELGRLDQCRARKGRSLAARREDEVGAIPAELMPQLPLDIGVKAEQNGGEGGTNSKSRQHQRHALPALENGAPHDGAEQWGERSCLRAGILARFCARSRLDRRLASRTACPTSARHTSSFSTDATSKRRAERTGTAEPRSAAPMAASTTRTGSNGDSS